MKLKHENYDQVTVISAAGDMTVDELEPLRKLVTNRLEADTRDFVIDLSGTEFVDSAGLEAMLWLQEQVDDRLGQVRLVAPQDNVRTILRITRLEHHFDAHDDVESALKSLR
jgi:anti-sigma B factor antagonist